MSELFEYKKKSLFYLHEGRFLHTNNKLYRYLSNNKLHHDDF